MRIKVILSADKSGIVDFNYQHQIQAVIYGFLSRSNPDYAQWLHQQGFIHKKDKRFKLFVFSGITFDGPIRIIRSNNANHSHNVADQCNLEKSPFLTNEGRLNSRKIYRDSGPLSNNFSRLNGFSFNASQTSPFTFSFQIASPVDKFIQHLVDGIFREGNEIILGRQKVTICRIETLPDPMACNSEIPGTKSEIVVKPLESPVFVKKPMPSDQQDIYLFPGDEGYSELLNQNLMHKYETLYGRPYEGEPLKFDFQCALTGRLKRFNRFKPKVIKSFKIFKNGKITGEIKGTLQPFTVSGSVDLIKIGLECGFGQNNSMGCGYGETDRCLCGCR